MKIALSPRQRWELAIVFASEVKNTSTLEEGAYMRCINALGIQQPLELSAAGKSVNLETAMGMDKSVFDLSEECVNYLFTKVVPMPRQGMRSFILGTVCADISTMQQTKVDCVPSDCIYPRFAYSENWAPKA